MLDNFLGSIEYLEDTICIIPDNLPFFEKEKIKLTSIIFNQGLVQSLPLEGYQHKIIRFIGQENSLLNYLDLLEHQHQPETLHSEFRLKLLLQKFFKSIELSIDTKIFTGAQIKQLQEYIHNNLQEPLRIPDLSKMMGINQQYFKTKFKNTFDSSVHEYIKYKRLQKALQMIRETNYTLQAIAIQVGYASMSSFSQSFKKHFGKPPIAFKISKN